MLGYKLLLVYLLVYDPLTIQVADCVGSVEVTFVKLTNKNMTLADGTTCKNDVCNVKLKAKFQEPAIRTFSTKLGKLEFSTSMFLPNTGVDALNDGSGRFDNPLNITAAGQDKIHQFAIDVDIHDYSHGTKKLMSSLHLTRNVSTGMVYNETLSSHHTDLEMLLEVMCDSNYFWDCSVHCVGADGNTGHYYCDPVTGDKVCLAGWTGENCLIRTCPSNVTILNGNVTPEQDIYQANDTVDIQCDRDFEINPKLNKTRLMCQDTGRWSSDNLDNLCTALCPVVEPGPNCTVNVTTTSSVDDLARLTCDPGYYFYTWENNAMVDKDHSDVVCRGDGTWGPIPSCLKYCDKFWQLAGGSVTSSSNNSVAGDSVTVTCYQGYNLTGPGDSTCLQNGAWSQAPPFCLLLACEELPAPDHGTVEYSTATRAVNSTAVLECPAGLCVSGETDTATCRPDQTWTETDVACQRGCETLASPEHGSLRYTVLNSCSQPGPGSQVEVQCEDTFVPWRAYNNPVCGSQGRWEYEGSEVEHLIMCIENNEVNPNKTKKNMLEWGIAIVIATLVLYLVIITAYYWTHRLHIRRITKHVLMERSADLILPEQDISVAKRSQISFTGRHPLAMSKSNKLYPGVIEDF